MTQPVRLYALDYLRGLSAAGIMVFHFVSFTYGAPDAHATLGRWGLYGVSVFYVISGLTLAHVYKDSLLPTRKSLLLFYSRRAFRIFPLFIAVTLMSVFIVKKHFSIYDIFMNITGLFGPFDHANNIALGSWSIGNELCFYLLFPWMIYIARKRTSYFISLIALVLIAYVAFAFWAKAEFASISDFWYWYIHPLNQAFLFMAGVAIAFYYSASTRIEYAFILLAIGCALFAFWPGSGDRITLVTGFSRLVLSSSVILMAMCFYTLPKASGLLHAVLHFLGETSFSVYMLHNIVWVILSALIQYSGFILEGTPKILAAVTLTIATSYVAYQFFEKPCIKLGHRINE
ncbi:MAG: acyltransferase family protein [Flavobacteriales bacterium]